MRWLYHHRTAGRGAEGVHIASVVRALQRLGHDVEVLSPPGVNPLFTAGSTPLDKGNVRASGVTRLWRWLSRSSPQWAFECAELAYNLYAAVRLVAHGGQAEVFYERYAFFLAAGVVIAKRQGRRVILEVNEVVGVHRARGMILEGVARRLERRVFSTADEIVTVSSFLRDEILSRGGHAGHVHVVPNAIDPARFAAADGRKVRAARGLSECIVVGFVGWFDRWDRLDLLLDVAARLRAEHPDLRLLLVGDGPVLAELRERVASGGLSDLVILTGPVPPADVPSYIDAMDICVLPDSNVFGSPIVLFEFMALGKAVVGPDLAPIRDVLEDGCNGLVVPRGDVPALTAAVKRLAGDAALRRQLGTAARNQVDARHTWDATGRFVAGLAGAPAAGRAVTA
jgi:glycosyltransferase involved in cell wall biosynthesis